MIIIFEGLCGAGKTTLINKYKHKDVIRIPQFINEPADIFDDLTCMKNDELKFELAYKNRNKIVLIDRGYLSTLIYGLIRYKVTKHKEKYSHIKRWLLENLNSKLIRPDYYIWVDAPNEVCMKRVNGDNRLLPDSYWYKDLDEARDQYNKLFQTIDKDVPLYKLDGELSIDTNLAVLNKIINENITNKR